VCGGDGRVAKGRADVLVDRDNGPRPGAVEWRRDDGDDVEAEEGGQLRIGDRVTVEDQPRLGAGSSGSFSPAARIVRCSG
jgi:hypothetical protein